MLSVKLTLIISNTTFNGINLWHTTRNVINPLYFVQKQTQLALQFRNSIQSFLIKAGAKVH